VNVARILKVKDASGQISCHLVIAKMLKLMGLLNCDELSVIYGQPSCYILFVCIICKNHELVLYKRYIIVSISYYRVSI